MAYWRGIIHGGNGCRWAEREKADGTCQRCKVGLGKVCVGWQRPGLAVGGVAGRARALRGEGG